MPQQQAKRSGPNYGMLGRIVEDVTEGSVASAYRARLFDPLGVKASFFAPEERAYTDV
jgi:CubicO group peptidase (beta-lactamase class C family)